MSAGLGGGGARPAFVKGTQHWEAMAGHRWQEVPFREALGFLKRVAQERKCPHCEATNEPLVLDKASRMLTGGQGQKYFSPVIARHILRQAWARDPRTFRSLFAGFDLRNAASSLALVPGGGGGSTFTRTMKLYSKWVGDVGPDRFFVTALPVPANRFRPVQHVNGNTVQHPTTVMLAQLLKTNLELREVVGTGTFDPEQADANDDRFEHSVRLLSDLQQNFHKLLAGEADTPGQRKVLDKQERPQTGPPCAANAARGPSWRGPSPAWPPSPARRASTSRSPPRPCASRGARQERARRSSAPPQRPGNAAWRAG